MNVKKWMAAKFIPKPTVNVNTLAYAQPASVEMESYTRAANEGSTEVHFLP